MNKKKTEVVVLSRGFDIMGPLHCLLQKLNHLQYTHGPKYEKLFLRPYVGEYTGTGGYELVGTKDK